MIISKENTCNYMIDCVFTLGDSGGAQLQQVGFELWL